MSQNFQYIGNSAYCYANCTSMLLSTIGENISPAFIEVLTGVGLSATVEKSGFLFLNNQVLEPDLGIISVIKLLGFESDVYFSENPEDYPFEELKATLLKHPAILGPLDMGYLTYNPNYPHMHGGDHFVLAYKSDGDNLYLQDPAGFPHTFINKADLKLSWKAEKVSYRKGYYRYITNIRKVSSPSPDEIYKSAINRFKKIYQVGEAKTSKANWNIGSEAIRNTIQRLKDKHVSQPELDNFVYFVFQLGARRAQDFANFFKEKHPELSKLKFEQSKILGQAHASTVYKDWDLLVETLENLAENEDKFKTQLLGS